MNSKNLLVIITLIVVSFTFASCKTPPDKISSSNNTTVITENFENVSIGAIPKGWKIENTNLKGELPEWKTIKDKSAPSGEKVLCLADTKKSSGSSFNLCWTKNIAFDNGTVEVDIKAVNGEEDQGGGVIWRAKDKNNYYVVRFNPLEDNFRIYYVKNGKRKKIKSANVKLPKNKWFNVKIVQNDNKYECYLNGKKLIEGCDDNIKGKGGVGIWTKADAASLFDNFKAEQK